MKFDTAFDSQVTLVVTWGKFEQVENNLSLVFSIEICDVVWKEEVAFFPLLKILSDQLEETPLPSSMSGVNFPSDLVNQYDQIVSALVSRAAAAEASTPAPHDNTKEEELLASVCEKVERFICELLSNLPALPKEVQGICKQLFFRSVHKIQVCECLLGHAWRSIENNVFLDKSEPKEMNLLKKALAQKTEGDLFRDALQGIKAELALEEFSSAEAARPSNHLSLEASAVEPLIVEKGNSSDLRLSVSSLQSPLLASFRRSGNNFFAEADSSPGALGRGKVDLARFGLTDLDVATTRQNLRKGIDIQFLLPDKTFQGRLCPAVLKVLDDMDIVDVTLTIHSGHKTKNTRLLYDIKEDVGVCMEGKGPTILSIPSDLSTARVCHLLLHNRPELNFVVEDEFERNKLMFALNASTVHGRKSEMEVTRRSSVASSFREPRASSNAPSPPSLPFELSASGGRPPLAPLQSNFHSNYSIADPGAGAQTSGISEETKEVQEESEGPEIMFTVPMKIVDFCWGYGVFKAMEADDAMGNFYPRIALRERLPSSFLTTTTLKLLIYTNASELIVFNLPASWTHAENPKVKEMSTILRNLIGVPFPINVFEKKKVVAEVSFCDVLTFASLLTHDGLDCDVMPSSMLSTPQVSHLSRKRMMLSSWQLKNGKRLN
eukprot:scaffold4094_cov201-Ochromonas_danica.AAC.1